MNTRNQVLSAAVAFALLASSTRAAEVHVPQQFPTIQAAIDASQFGDVILVAAGNYAETLTIASKPNRAIVGKGKVVIDGDGGTDVVAITGSDSIRLENLRLRGGTNNGVHADASSSRLTLRKLRFEAPGFTAIHCEGDDAFIDAVTIQNRDGAGLVLEGDSSFVRKVSVKSVGQRGIIVDGARNIVSQCYVESSGSDGIVVLGTDSMNVVSQCSVKSSDAHSLWVASATSNNLVRNSTVKKSDSTALRAHGANTVLLGNKINDSSQVGIDCLGVVLSSGNTVKNTLGDAGYRIQSTADAGLHASNTVWKSAVDGFVINGGATANLLSRNKAKGSKTGFDLNDISAGQNALIGNTFPEFGP